MEWISCFVVHRHHKIYSSKKKKRRFGGSPRSFMGYTNDLLANIFARKQTSKSRWSTFQAFIHVFNVNNLPLLVVTNNVFQEAREQVQVITLQEPLHPDSLWYETEHVVYPWGILQALLRHHPANRNPAMNPHVEKRCVEHVPTHVVKVDVNALWEVPAHSN